MLINFFVVIGVLLIISTLIFRKNSIIAYLLTADIIFFIISIYFKVNSFNMFTSVAMIIINTIIIVIICCIFLSFGYKKKDISTIVVLLIIYGFSLFNPINAIRTNNVSFEKAYINSYTTYKSGGKYPRTHYVVKFTVDGQEKKVDFDNSKIKVEKENDIESIQYKQLGDKFYNVTLYLKK